MTIQDREFAKNRIEYLLKISSFALDEHDKEALELATQALSQEPCELLIIKSDILLHQDDRKKWVESIKREKESGVIILPPYFEPLLVPNDIEINIEQEPCDDAISREELLKAISTWDKFGCDANTKLVPYKDHYIPYIHYDDVIKCIKGMPSVTQKSGKWIVHPEIETSTPEYLMFYECSECGDKQCFCKSDIHKKHFCNNCGAKMVEPQESEDKK